MYVTRVTYDEMKKILTIGLLVSYLGLADPVFNQTKAVPIAEMKISGLLGGVENGKWLTPDAMSAKMEASPEFVLVGWKGVEEGGVSVGTKAPSEDVCQEFVRLEFDLKADTGVALGSAAKWRPTPRLATAVPLANATYKNVIAAHLRTKGIAKPVVKLTQAYRVDVEGDGVEEVLLTATRYKGGMHASSAVGDYSVILLRKVVGRRVVNYEIEGEYLKKGDDLGAPNEYRVSAIADLNGDGKMEIVVYSEYYEGAAAGVVEMKNGKPVTVKELAIGCGV